jgi:hypothetical protein
MKKIFSIPLNVSLTEIDFENFKTFLQKYQENIFDIYFSFKIPPFNEDAVGAIAESQNIPENISCNLEKIISIQSECNVRVSATFNNIFIPPDQENLNLFINNFSPLYEMGIRSVTLPFSSWVFDNRLKKNFPELFIKNTVLWKVHSSREFWNLAETGFDYINLDRTLLRNQKALKEISKARDKFYNKTGKRVLLSILANESPCSGFCPFREEHHSLLAFNNVGVDFFPSYINVCLYSHMKYLEPKGIKMNYLKMAFISPFEDDFYEIRKYIDVFKLFGRIQPAFFKSSLKEIENFINGAGFLTNLKNILTDYGENKNNQTIINKWRKEIRNCNFNCWKCNLCDRIFDNLSCPNQKLLSDNKVY